jgi:hypothetical protein
MHGTVMVVLSVLGEKFPRTLGGPNECGKIKPEPPDSPLKMSFEDMIDLFACAKPRCM